MTCLDIVQAFKQERLRRMPKHARQTITRLAMLSACAAGLAGCAASQANEIRIVSTEGALRAFKPIANSSQAPCKVQREIAAHNSVYDSLRLKQQIVYSAPCDSKTKPSPVSS